MSDDWLPDRPDRGLDYARVASGRLRNEFSMAQLNGAENLLTKAQDALEAGDDERAERFIRRAAAMPWDDREWHFPGVVGDAPLNLELCDDPDTPEDERVETIRSLVEASLAYHQRYWH